MATTNIVIRRASLFLSLLMLSFGTQAALNEVNGNNPYTLSPAVSVGSYYDIVLQIKNNGSSLVNLTSVSTTGPFTLQWNGCGTSLAPGAGCNGNFGLRFTPTAVGPATGTLVVGNDGPDGPFTLNLVATGSALLAPTVATSLSPSTIYTGTGVSALTWTVANPNSVSVIVSSFNAFNVNLPAGITTAANLNPTISCGNGTWYGVGAQSPARQSFVYFSANIGPQPEVPALGSCVMSIDISSPNAPGSYTLDVGQPIMFQEVWSALPTIAQLTVIAPTAGAPGAPAIVAVTRGNTQAAVTFAPPSDIGSSPIAGYTVTSRPTGGVDSNAGSTSLTHIITGLANGTSYTFTVSATNLAGTSAPSTPSGAVTPATSPGAPTNVIATADPTQAIVTFAEPANLGGNPITITGYTVISSPAGGVDSNAGTTARSHKITGLTTGNDYTFTVVASNEIGTSPQSPPSNSITAGKIAVARPPIQTKLQIPTVRSNIPTKTWTIPPGPRVNSFEPAYQIPRSIEFADFNGDGLLDIIVAPAFPQHAPELPVATWLNRGDGTFYDATSELIDGPPTLTWSAQQLLIGDFNGDGRPDVLFSSTGAEHAVEEGLSDSGYFNTLLLSQPNGKYKDATANININPRAFNHQDGMGDANGDRNLDFVVLAGNATIGGAQGVRLYYGDGQGNFVDATSALPQEIRNSVKTPGEGFQQTGCAGMADLDGDGKSEIITGSYSFGDRLADGSNGTRTVRFHKIGEDGKFTEVSRISIPDAISTIPYGYNPPPPVFAGLGCSQILAGDFNGDGRTDLLIQWEGAGPEYVELLRNDGNFQFTDITLDALGTYNTSFPVGSGQQGPGHFRLMDINGDGTLDIVNLYGSLPLDVLLPHLAYLNDGTGHFTPWVPQGSSGALTSTEVLSASKCPYCGYEPLVFDTNKSGVASLVLLDFESSVSTTTPSQTTAVYLTNFASTATALGVPSILSATAGDGSASIAFKAYDGGTAATGFTATCTGGPTPLTGTATASPIVVTGMSNGTSYGCSVKANNSSGSSIASAAVAVTPLGAVVSLSPSALSFATQGVGTSSTAQTIALTNSGGASLNLTSIAAGGDFAVTNNCGGGLAAGGSCSLNVTFTPTAAGTRTGAITITSNATGSPHSVTLSGAAAITARLINLSTRGSVQTGDNVMIGGFVIGGSSPKKVLIRAVGPNLANYGVTGVLGNPMLELHRSSDGAIIASNDNWGDAANAAAIQATGQAPVSPFESAILATLDPGAYTAIVTGNGGGTGVGIVEVYDIDHPEIPLINISTRGQVQTGDNVMIGGFIIQGDSPQTVLIRAVGPNLLNYGVTGVLADPMLELHRSSDGAIIASNDNWGDAANAAAILATGLAPVSPLESAILITLPPGAYTAIVSGTNGGTGVGIVEVFAQ